VPFRNAHEIVGKIVLWSIQHNVYLLDVPLEEYQNAHASIEADIYDYLKPENCVSRRISYGSTGQEAVKQQINIIKQQL
jgi:argininosuccinate lyase